jgi:PAS domain-containing protein
MSSEPVTTALPTPSELLQGQTLLAAVRQLSLELDAVRADAGPEFSARLSGAEDELAAIEDEMRQQQHEIEDLLNGAGSHRSAMMHRFLSSLPLATVVTGSSGMILEANPEAHSLLRVASGGLPGKPIFAYITHDDRRLLRSALSRTADSDAEEPLQISVTVAPRHGPVIPARLALVRNFAAAEPEPAPAAGLSVVDRSSSVFWVVLPNYDGIEEPPSYTQLEALTRLCRLGSDGSDLQTTIGQVVQLCRQAMSEANEVSLLVGSPLEPSLAVASSAVAQHLDGLQHGRGCGPAFDAHRTRRPVALYGKAVTEHHGLCEDPQAAVVRSLLSVPLLVDGRPAGVLTLYATGEKSVATLVALRQVMPFVEASQSLIRDTNAREEMLRTQQQLEAALTSRAVIDQAKGMIMLTLKCTADEAFGHLVRMSSTRHEKVRDVAQNMLDDVVKVPVGSPPSPSE